MTNINPEHLKKSIQEDILYFDFWEAFDRVDNDVLLQKLNTVGLAPNLLIFFCDRQQYVQYGHFVSIPNLTRSGISQGSVLGPSLFGIVVNYLELFVSNAQCLLYVDQLKLVYGWRVILTAFRYRKILTLCAGEVLTASCLSILSSVLCAASVVLVFPYTNITC